MTLPLGSDIREMPQIQLNEYQLDDLQRIRDLGSEPLKRVAAALSAASQGPLRPNRLKKRIADALGENASVAESLTRQLLTIHGLMSQVGLSDEEAVRGIHAELQRRWTSENFNAWSEVSSPFFELVRLKTVRTTAKVLDLTYEYANLYRRARILTDIRPLFGEHVDTIEGAVISFTLRLRYDSTDGNHGLSIALDEEDIRELAKQCERALDKAKTAEAMMKLSEVPTIVTGREQDDD